MPPAKLTWATAALTVVALVSLTDIARADRCRDVTKQNINDLEALDKEVQIWIDRVKSIRDPSRAKVEDCKFKQFYLKVFHPRVVAIGQRFDTACGSHPRQCDFACRKAKAEKDVLDACGSLPPKADEPQHVKSPRPAVAQPKAPTPTGQSVSCGDITGTGGAPAATHCAAAKKSMQAARDARKTSPTVAAGHYKEAAKRYRLASDDTRAATVMMEAAAPDVAVFIQEEGLSDAMKKNLAEAENWARIGRKIEEGAFESGSCGDLLKAADFYLKAGSYYLKADQFAMTNAIFLRRDRLGSIVDEAKRTGACGNPRVSTRRPPPPIAPSTEERISPEDCRKIITEVKAKPNLVETAEETAGIVLPVELAVKGCRDPSVLPLTRGNCTAAHIRWRMNRVKTAEVQRRLKLAGCPS